MLTTNRILYLIFILTLTGYHNEIPTAFIEVNLTCSGSAMEVYHLSKEKRCGLPRLQVLQVIGQGRARFTNEAAHSKYYVFEMQRFEPVFE